MATWGQAVTLSDDEPVVKEENKRKLGPRTQPSKGGRKKTVVFACSATCKVQCQVFALQAGIHLWV